MSERKFFKIMNLEEKHYDFQYKDGLNILIEEFDDVGECCPGGFYFTDIDNLPYFFNLGVWLRDVELPLEDPEFKMVLDPSGGKWRANKIILGKKRSLYELETLKYLEKQGACFKNSYYLELALENDNVEMFQFLMNKGHEIRYLALCKCLDRDNYPNICEVLIKNKYFTDADDYMRKVNAILNYSVGKNNISFVEMIFQNYPNITLDILFCNAAIAFNEGKMDCFKFILTGTDNFTLTNNILCKLFDYNYNSILNYLIQENTLESKGIDFGDNNNEIFIRSAKSGNITILNFLLKKMDVLTIKSALCTAITSQQLDVVKFLHERCEIDTSDLGPLLVKIAPTVSPHMVKYLVKELKINPAYNNNEAIKCAQRHKNKRVAAFLAQTCSKFQGICK